MDTLRVSAVTPVPRVQAAGKHEEKVKQELKEKKDKSFGMILKAVMK